MRSSKNQPMVMKRRRFLRWLKWVALGTSIAAGGGFGYAHWERHALDVTRVELDLGLRSLAQGALPDGGLRVGLLSDFHFDERFEVEYFEKVIEVVSQQSLDVLCLTGDFVSGSLERFEELAAILGRAQTRLGIYAVMGNHDFWAGEEELTRLLRAEGIQVLRNEGEELTGLKGIFVSGLDSYWAGKPDWAFVEKTVEDSKHILLVHEPDSFDEMRARQELGSRVALQLSGHTHGGQIRAPFFGALWLPSWGRKYVMGLYQRGKQFLYVNRGVGTIKFPLRFLCRPELTVFELR